MTTTAAVYPEVQAALAPATVTLESAYGCTWPPLADLRVHRYVGRVPLTPLLRRILERGDSAFRSWLDLACEHAGLRMMVEITDWMEGKRGGADRVALFRFRRAHPEYRLAGPRGRLP